MIRYAYYAHKLTKIQNDKTKKITVHHQQLQLHFTTTTPKTTKSSQRFWQKVKKQKHGARVLTRVI